MTLETVRFEGHECVRVSGGATTLFLTIDLGPRILGMTVHERNVFAVLPEDGLVTPDGERFRFLGGHRLWAAPEVPEITYRHDERPCSVTETGAGVRVDGDVDGAGIARSIEVAWGDGGWVVDHRLRNAGSEARRVAPWAITQFPPGGEASIPMPSRRPGPRADRSLVLWPYTDPADPRLRIGAEELRLRAGPGPAPIKVGAAPSEGVAAYEHRGARFETRIEVVPDAPYPDRGAAVQVYVCDRFCELETLGPLRDLEPGGVADHRERWTVRTDPDGSA